MGGRRRPQTRRPDQEGAQRYPTLSRTRVLKARSAVVGSAKSRPSATRLIVLNNAQTSIASRIASGLTPASSTARTSGGPTSLGVRVNFSNRPRVALTRSSTLAVRQLVTTAAVVDGSRTAEATASWVVAQNWQRFRADTNAAKSSRSPIVHGDGPRITAWASAKNGLPKNRGRW